MKEIIDRSEFLENLSEEELNAGYIKFNIPDPKWPYNLSGEGVGGWCNPSDKVKYDDDSYTGKIIAILSNWPLNYMGLLKWGSQVQLVCHGSGRPTLDPEWITEIIKDPVGV